MRSPIFHWAWRLSNSDGGITGHCAIAPALFKGGLVGKGRFAQATIASAQFAPRERVERGKMPSPGISLPGRYTNVLTIVIESQHYPMLCCMAQLLNARDLSVFGLTHVVVRVASD